MAVHFLTTHHFFVGMNASTQSSKLWSQYATALEPHHLLAVLNMWFGALAGKV
jgi:hypothetical protein